MAENLQRTVADTVETLDINGINLFISLRLGKASGVQVPKIYYYYKNDYGFELRHGVISIVTGAPAREVNHRKVVY